MDIKGIWVATSKNSQLHQVYKILISKDERKKFTDVLNLKRYFNDFGKRQSDINKRSPKRLLEGDEYYITNTAKEIEASNLTAFYEIIINNSEELQKQETLTFKRSLQEYDEKERERFFIILVKRNGEKYFLFIYLDSRNIVRKRTYLDRDFSLNRNSTIIDVTHGIPIPEEITALYNWKSQQLFVHEVFQFERMLHLHEAYKEMARKQIKKFIEGVNTVGKESYKVTGLDSLELKTSILDRVRFTKRIADFNKGNSNYPIANIKKAVRMLPDKKDHVEFCPKSKEIKVNKENVGTFVAIVHDSIVQRVISGEIELI